jgi:hypothetical protein
MEPTREMKAQFTPEELENLSINEEAFLSNMDSITEPTREMQRVFNPEELKDLSIKEEAFFADQELAEISIQKQRTPDQIKKTINRIAEQTELNDATRRKPAIKVGRPLNSGITNTANTRHNFGESLAHSIVRSRRVDSFENRNLPLGELSASEKRLANAVNAGIKGNLPLTFEENNNMFNFIGDTYLNDSLPDPFAGLDVLPVNSTNEASDYALKEAAGYFNNEYFNMGNEAAYADDIIESYEVLDGPIAAIASRAKAAGASGGKAVASAVAGKASTASSTTSHIIKGVETATDLVSFNKKTAAAAAGLGLAGGYFANRKRTRR